MNHNKAKPDKFRSKEAKKKNSIISDNPIQNGFTQQTDWTSNRTQFKLHRSE